MKPFEYEIESLKSIINEMLNLVRKQMLLTKEALLDNNQEISEEVMRNEKRVNSIELSIERECEDFLALQAPVATDLRFAIAMLKISGDLERIGDHAYGISNFVFDDLLALNKQLIELLLLETVFTEIDEMFENVIESLDSGDIQFAKRVFKQDKVLDKLNKKIPKLLDDYLKDKKDSVKNLILISRTIGKLERVGDLLKNIAEDIIFYYESKVLRHKKKNKRIEKKLGTVE